MGELLLALRIAMALILYLFLGIAFYILWRGLRQNEQERTGQVVHAQLVIEQGIDVGKVLVLRPVTTIGRAADNPVALDDEFASANHAMILWRETTWWLEDLESHNGTFLNGEKIVQPVALTSGDQVRIGGTILRFEVGQTGGDLP